VNATIVLLAALRSSPQPIITLMLIGFAVGVFGHLSGYRIFVAIGIGIVFLAALLAPQF
jgi:hypothetical protein